MRTLEEMAYDLALRALGQQEAALTELRSRTGTLLAGSSLTTSFLGAPALRDGWEIALALGLAAFAAVVVLSLGVLLPRRQLVFALDAREAYQTLYGMDVDESRRRVAYWLEALRERNRATIARQTARFESACAALVAQIALLTLALAIP